MRHLTHDGSGNLADLIKDHQTERSTLGILLTMPTQNSRTPRGVRPGMIRDLTVGGPAALSGMVRVGDEIVAVDGTAVHDTESVSALVRGSDDIGTMCCISLLRNGELFDVELIRGSSTRMRTVEKLFKLISSAEAQARHGRIESVLQALLFMADALSTSENARMHRESRLAARLSRMQVPLFVAVSECCSVFERSSHLSPHTRWNARNVVRVCVRSYWALRRATRLRPSSAHFPILRGT